ncbi:hypothetical protein M0657_001519 [Pyricularia oryzae]|uniref:Pentatricopeptide repeat protein n=2 Tax=Pyricularia oryzae TaxID=318829 RepID=A0AA97NRA0_PYRO3|nr:hypothetical protein OOU_Y34scaffold00744g19 [Pyricularia oryzae Y34]KAI7930779.1 hypothetical protein M0657_001519 [Pyricularia oryzae]
MSSKTLVDLGCRSNYICRSCLLALPKPTLPKPSASRYYSRPARSSSRAPAPRPVRRGRAPIALNPRPGLKEETPARKDDNEKEDDVLVRYFEQDPSGKRREISSQAKFEESMEDETKAALDEINQLEELLKSPNGLMEMAKRMGLLSEDGKVINKDLNEALGNEDGEFAHEIDVEGLNVRQTRQIMQLNWNLQRATKKMKTPGKVRQKTIYDAWRLYSLARPVLQNSWERVPPVAWDLLWDLLSWDGPENTSRMSRVYQLGKDLRNAGVDLDDGQQLLLIEAAFVDGKRTEALEAWRRFVPVDPASEEKYLELGVRMYSIHGDVDRAHWALEKYLALPEASRSSPRFILHFIRACVRDSRRQDLAWDMYRLLRKLLGKDMKIEDYDEVISALLVAKHTETAFHVFVDMMFSGTIDARGKTRLPLKVANQFFMGKWLKRLIGAGDLEGALSVLKFMQTKGILAAKVQVNGLIGAMLRSGVAENLEKGEQIAWAMIQSRKTFVELRRREALVDWPIRLLQTPQSKDEVANRLGLHFIPQASLETFSLMAENYRERRLHTKLEKLWVAFQSCEITTDAFMLNQLLESYNQEGQGEKARDVYNRLTEEHLLQPDAYTFFALYKSLAVNRLFWSAVTDEIRHKEIAICRDLFSRMVSSTWTFSTEGANEQPRGALTRMLLHSFRKCGDHTGLLVALRALWEVYGYSPSHMICLELLAETADLSHSNRKLVEVNQRIQAAFDASAEEAAREAGVQQVELTEEQKAEVLLALLQDHYYQKIGVSSDEEFNDRYHMAVEEMGLADILVDQEDAQ